MAETTTTTTTTPTATKPKPAAKRRATAKRKPATRRTTSATRRTGAKTTPSTATGRRQRTIARNETRDAAQAQVKAAKTTAAQGRNVAERAALVYVGATLEARDRVVGLAEGISNRFGTRKAAERELNKDIRRFERRGNTARNQLERDVKKARTRLERELRTRRRDAQKLVTRNATAAKDRVTALV